MNLFALTRGVYGALVVAAPDRVVRLYSGHPARGPARPVARLLGARHVLQAGLTVGSPTAPVLLLGAAADAAHALSAAVLASCDRPRRRAGLIDAAVAASFAATGTLLARRAGQAPPPHGDPTGLVARLARLRSRWAASLATVLIPRRMVMIAEVPV